MLTIWKFPLTVEDEQRIHPPKGAEFLTIQIQNGEPCLWALVDTDRPKDSIKLITKGTGHPIKDKEIGKYIGTYQYKGNFVFHVFHSWSPDYENHRD
jgi:hypothetical protein